jgi:hypothetical protein
MSQKTEGHRPVESIANRGYRIQELAYRREAYLDGRETAFAVDVLLRQPSGTPFVSHRRQEAAPTKAKAGCADVSHSQRPRVPRVQGTGHWARLYCLLLAPDSWLFLYRIFPTSPCLKHPVT